MGKDARGSARQQPDHAKRKKTRQPTADVIDYATASKITGPWTCRGTLTKTAKNSFTIHPGIVEFKNQF